MKITVIGTGYVGLVTGTCLAELGNDVLCMDVDKKKIENLKKGIIPIYEPDLETLAQKNISAKKLKFTTNGEEAIEFGEVVFSAVGTPENKDHRADLKYVKLVAETFGKYANAYKVYVNKSTVPVKTGEICEKIIRKEFLKRKIKFDFDLVSNPEFLREGRAIKDTFNPDRIVIGTKSSHAKEIMGTLYKPLTDKGIELISTDIKTAEIIKYASNAMLATKISFINEIANFCEKAGGNIKVIAKTLGLDKRIGPHFLHAGIGYGGSCLPKDVKALIQTGKDLKYNFKLLKAVDEINKTQKEIIFHKLKKELKTLKNKHIAIWGLSFKPKTDDMREAPSITIIQKLHQEKAKIFAYDPEATNQAKKILKNIPVTYGKTPIEIAKNADALLLLTEWEEFSSIDFQKLKSVMKNPLILDGRNFLKKNILKNFGIKHIGIGI